MKTLLRFLFLVCLLVFSSKAFGQISNLLVNGSSTHFSMDSGDEISWSYDLPEGGYAVLEIWLDLNSNTVIDPETDLLWEAFYQIDGQNNYNGPPDMDGLVNGHIIFAQEVGLAPGEYIMSFTNNDVPVSIAGTVSPLAAPVFTISGSVTVPQGESAQYLIINLGNGNEDGNKFWNAITDAEGNFTVHMDADTSGNPWRLDVTNTTVLSPAVLSPDRISLTLDAGVSTTYPGNDFTFTEAAAEINGTVKDEDGTLLIGVDVYLNGNSGGISRYIRTDNAGTFRIGFLPGELPASDVELGSGYSEDNNIVTASIHIPAVISGNVLTRNLTVYQTNSTISGNVTLEGNPPNMNLEIVGVVSDTGYVRTFTDMDGNYTLNVSDKLYNYNISSMQLPPNYIPYSINAYPGQTGVNFNFTLTDAEEEQSVIPNEFSLLQNFPNPFNPVTVISYNLKEAGNVQIKIFNVLGIEVETLVNEQKPAGNYEITWDAGNSAAGIYFYRLNAGSFTDMKKMVLLK